MLTLIKDCMTQKNECCASVHKAAQNATSKMPECTCPCHQSKSVNHFHCWEQFQPPACDLKGKHKRCCLCEATAPQSKSVEGLTELQQLQNKLGEVFSIVYTDGYEKRSYEILQNLEGTLAALLTKAYERGYREALIDVIEINKKKLPHDTVSLNNLGNINN